MAMPRAIEQPQPDNDMAARAAAEAVPDPGRQIYLNEARVRIDAALAAESGFAERAGVVLVEPLLRLGRQDPEYVGRIRA